MKLDEALEHRLDEMSTFLTAAAGVMMGMILYKALIKPAGLRILNSFFDWLHKKLEHDKRQQRTIDKVQRDMTSEKAEKMGWILPEYGLTLIQLNQIWGEPEVKSLVKKIQDKSSERDLHGERLAYEDLFAYVQRHMN